MERRTKLWSGVVAGALALAAPPLAAQRCGISSFGGSTRFADPVDSIAELQALFTSKSGEIERELVSAGWTGDPDDLFGAVARARVTERSYPNGTRFEWMMLRKRGAPILLRNDCWGGSKPFRGYAIDLDSNGRRWHFVVPMACGNVALLGSEAIAAARERESAAAPRQTYEAPPPAGAAAPAEVYQPAAAVSRPVWVAEIFAGYFFPEELDEDLTFGFRFGQTGFGRWGWLVGVSWFDVADSQGFSGRNVDADVVHVDASAVFYPGTYGSFSIFFGPGWASGNVDIPGSTEDLSDDAFTLHAGVGWEFDVTPSFYVKPDLRLRWYELEGFGPEGGRESQLTYEAAIALGWRFGRL